MSEECDWAGRVTGGEFGFLSQKSSRNGWDNSNDVFEDIR